MSYYYIYICMYVLYCIILHCIVLYGIVCLLYHYCPIKPQLDLAISPFSAVSQAQVVTEASESRPAEPRRRGRRPYL